MSKIKAHSRVASVTSLLVVTSLAVVAHATPPAGKPAPAPLEPSGVKLEGDVIWTAVSGDTADKAASLGQDNDFQALYAFTRWEDSDDPCKFDAFTRHLNQEDDTKVDSTKFCSGSPGNDKTVIRRAKNEYVTAVQVCATDKNESARDKVKGVRLWGRIVDPKTGVLGAENGPAEATHTNCKEWKAKVSCPAGTVASKLKVYSSRYTWSDAGVGKGLALGCRRVVRKS